MAFLGIRTGMATMPMSNTVSMGPAVAGRVRYYLPVGVIAATPSSAATLGLGRKLVTEGFDLVGEGSVGGGKGRVSGNKCLKDSCLMGGSTGKVVQALLTVLDSLATLPICTCVLTGRVAGLLSKSDILWTRVSQMNVPPPHIGGLYVRHMSMCEACVLQVPCFQVKTGIQ